MPTWSDIETDNMCYLGNHKGNAIVMNCVARNDFETPKERIEVVNIVCNHMMNCNPQKHLPSVNTKHLYAAANIKSSPCLTIKQEDQDGGVSFNHDVLYHLIGGGFIEDSLKEIRRKEGMKKRNLMVSPKTVN